MLGDEAMSKLLQYCKDYPEEYNTLSLIIFDNFGIASAEVILFATFCAIEFYKKKEGD